jgi:signal transduction histidine kinase
LIEDDPLGRPGRRSRAPTLRRVKIRERLWPGLRTRGIVLEFAIAVPSVVAIGAGAATGQRGSVSIALFSVLTAVVFVLLLTLRRRAPFVPFLLSAVLSVVSPAINGALTPLSYAMGRYVGRWPSRITAAVVGMLVVARPWDGGPVGEAFSRWLGGAVLVLLPGAVGVYVRTRALLLAALRDRAEKAEAERELLARDAVLTERTRIAREMHDAVGHRVSLMVLQAGAIEMAAADEHRVQQLAGQVQTAGRQALDELRQMVGVLRAEDADGAAPLGPQPGLADLATLVAQSRDAGMAVELTGPAEGLGLVDPVAGRAAYRIVQEALTNAGKHAPGAAVRVCVERRDAELVVRVANGPSPAPANGAPSGGYGLVGLGERVRTLGGRLSSGPRLDGGFEVEAVLPA